MGRREGSGLGGDRRCRRHDHPPPRGRARPPAVVRPPASRAVRRRAQGGEARARPRRDHEPRSADRPVRAFLSDRLNLAWVISGLLLVAVVLLVPNEGVGTVALILIAALAIGISGAARIRDAKRH